ncbi:MAG: FAD-dependent monooxygenase, partial [Burkholderiales bacterium]
PPATVQYCDPARPVTFVRGTGERRRWEIMLMPGDDPDKITDPDNVWRLISRWVTPEDAVLERGALYTFHSLIATRWRDRRLLIAGDSAHQTPPFLGQGMCAGIRDSANLGWKLARVLDGRAPPALLDTYQSERTAHVRHFIELAVTLGDLIQTTDPAVAAARDQVFEAGGTMALVNLSPALGAGLHTGQKPGGELLAQARLPDGRPADDVIGTRFAAIGDLNLASPSARATLERIGTAFISNAPGNPPLGPQPSLLLRRPDRYTFGRAESVAEFDTLVSRLDRSLA